MLKSELKFIILECIDEMNFKTKIGIKKPRKKFPNWMDPIDNSGIKNPTRSSFDIFKARQKYNSKPPMTGTNFKSIMGKKKNTISGKMINLKRKISGGRL